MSPTRYSPEPITHYPSAKIFKLLAADALAWNLAYLSFAFENRKSQPDPHLSVNVFHTLRFVLATGAIDLADRCQPSDKVCGLMHGPAAQVAHKIATLACVKQLPMYLAYGAPWLALLQQRAQAWREPHDAQFDFAVPDCSQALEVIRVYQ